MDASNLAAYYNSLFVISVTVIGVGIASVIALTQILSPLLAFKSTQRLLQSWDFVSTTALLLLVTLISASANYFLSIGKHNLITFVDFHTEAIVTNDWFVLMCLLLLIASFVLMANWIIKEARYLITENALSFLKETIPKDTVKEYFETMNSPIPMPPIRLTFVGEDEPAEDEKSDEELNEEYEQRKAKFEQDKKKFEKMDNPLLPLEAYLMQAIRRSDLQATTKTLDAFIEYYLEQIDQKNGKGLSSHLTQYYATALGNAVELADSIGMQSIVQQIIISSQKLSDRLLEKREVGAINNLVTLWQDVADTHMQKHPTTFKAVMSVFRSVGESILSDKEIKIEQNETLNNICRALGWLGERMLTKSPPEKKLIMNNDYQTEFNALMNAVFGIGWEYHRSRPDSYPLIFFDALYVIADKLAPYCTDEQASYDGSDGLFSLMHDVRSFAEVAIIAGNASGTALALRGVNDHMKIAKKNNLDDQVKYCLESILEIGAYAASAHLDDKVEFLMTSDGTVKGEATKIIVENHYGYDLSHAASELIIKFDKVKDYDELKKYLIEVGDAIGTNFGLRLKKEDEKS